jgi:hypothetical protein
MSDSALTEKEISALIDSAEYGFSPDEGTKAILDDLVEIGTSTYFRKRVKTFETVLKEVVYKAYKYGVEAGKRGK